MPKTPLSLLSAIAVALSLALSGCHSKSDDPFGEDTIYTVGSAMSPVDASMSGMIWKNGKVFKKTDFPAIFRAVFVYGDVVFAVGEALFSGDNHAFVWRSNDPDNYHRFGTDEPVMATGIHGTNKFSAFAVDDGGNIWNAINPSSYTVVNLGNNAHLNSIYFWSTDNFIGGYTRDANNLHHAALWLKKQPVPIEPFMGEFTNVNGGYDRFDDDNNVYAVGVRYENNETYPIWYAFGGASRGASGRLGNGNGIANSVSVYGTNVYIAGVDGVRNAEDVNGLDTQGAGRVWKGTADGTTFTPHLSFGTGKTPRTVHAVSDSVYTLVSEGLGKMISEIYRDGKSIHSFAYLEFPMHMFVVEGNKN